MRKTLFASLALLTWLSLSAAPPAAGPATVPAPDVPDLPEGFADTVVATGITGATALAVAPDGRVFVCEQTGTLRVVKGDKLLSEPFVRLEVDSFWERGLIGVTLDPDFPRAPYVYVCYVAAKPYPHHRVGRFTAKGDVAAPGSEVVLLRGDDQTKLGGGVPAGHQGGALHFGKDGKLYVAIGEGTAGAPSQRLDTFQGKLLRINRDGSVPEDNPLFRTAKGKYRAIWALGLRNPFAFAVQPGTGRIFINDVGDARLEEINEGAAGANYGWPESEGPTANPRHRGPLFAYDRNTGRSITGGAFYNPPVRQFPARYVGKYFFLDFMDNWLRVLDPDDPSKVEVFATGLSGPVDLATAPDGSLYYLNRNAWVKDEKFKPHTGSLRRITYGGGSAEAAPRLTGQPAEATVAEGQQATFRATAAGRAPLRYQWLKNGAPIPGGDGPSYTVAAAATEDSADFRCVVTNALGGTRSRRATLHVLPLRNAAPGPHTIPGVECRYYEGRLDVLPDVATLRPSRTDTAPTLELPDRAKAGGGGVCFSGYFEATADGVHRFHLHTDGVAGLWVAGTEVAHCTGWGSRDSLGAVGLRRGKHRLRLLFAPHTGHPELQLRYDGPDGREAVPVPAARLSRPDPDAPAPPAVPPADGTGGGLPYGLPPREPPLTLNIPADPAGLPPLLSQTGIFRSLRDLTPATGLMPYGVQSPLWSDGAAKRRWVALPGDAAVGFAATGEWTFPAGTVFVKHFELGEGTATRRLETRLLVVGGKRTGYGVTYRWRPDGTEAELLSEGLTEEVSLSSPAGPRAVTWTYPGRGDCLTCHTANAGFVLGAKTRQLNGPFAYPQTGVTDNQLRAWRRAGLFRNPPAEGEIPRLSRLAPLDDKSASLEHRVRSYLDANCAHCHRPGGARGLFDARFDTPLPRQNLVGGPLAAADLGVAGAKLVTPGDPERSMAYQRMSRRRDLFNMPPLASRQVDAEATALLAEWIRGLR
jgi:uncharacterized repeat protein (TIGR03806 family)